MGPKSERNLDTTIPIATRLVTNRRRTMATVIERQSAERDIKLAKESEEAAKEHLMRLIEGRDLGLRASDPDWLEERISEAAKAVDRWRTNLERAETRLRMLN
jgi:hypothetical protein